MPSDAKLKREPIPVSVWTINEDGTYSQGAIGSGGGGSTFNGLQVLHALANQPVTADQWILTEDIQLEEDAIIRVQIKADANVVLDTKLGKLGEGVELLQGCVYAFDVVLPANTPFNVKVDTNTTVNLIIARV
jgi:hypothetical protein